jgi:putative phosphoesterase
MIGIMSDSHDNRDAIRDAVRLFKRTGCRLVLHAGDFVAPFAVGELEALGCPVKAVFGNCDGEKAGLSKTVDSFGKIREAPFVFQYGGLEFLLTHTHFSLGSYIRSEKYDVIVYGHTHRPEVRRSGRSLIINPGETGGWVTGKRHVALLDLSTLDTEIVPLRILG